MSPSQERLRETIELAWLNLKDVDKIYVRNPFDTRTRFDIDNPHIFLLKLMRNPEYFAYTCKEIFNVQLAPFQCVLMKELWRRKYPMVIASRGGSKSWTLALYAMLRALLHQGIKIVVVGAAFRQAKVIFEYCETFWHNAPILRDICGSEGRSGPRRDIDRCTCILGDSTIIALPLGDGTKIRGQRANVIIADEFASIPVDVYENVVSGFAAVSADPMEKVMDVASIKAMKELGLWREEDNRKELMGNQVILAGTGYYDFNHFASYWKKYRSYIKSKGDPRALAEIFGGEIPDKFDWRDYSIFRLPVELLPEGFMDERHVARSKATMHSGTYQMEFGATFATDSTGFFKRSLLEACVADDKNSIDFGQGPIIFRPILRGDLEKKYIFGVDPASEKDKFSIVVIEVWPNHRRIVFCWTTTRFSHKERIKKGLVNEQDFYGYCARKIRDLMKVFPCERIVMDAQGGGIAVEEALHDPDKIFENENPIWQIREEGVEKDTDDKPGLHILEMVQFADSKWVHEANHGMRKDFEDKVLLFPDFDTTQQAEAIAEDKVLGRIYDTLEDCVMEIEELKNELTSIVHTQTNSGRDRWDVPEVKQAGGKKGRLRKDRYSALLMANSAARRIARAEAPRPFKSVGGFIKQVKTKVPGKLYEAPDWFAQKVMKGYGRVVKR